MHGYGHETLKKGPLNPEVIQLKPEEVEITLLPDEPASKERELDPEFVTQCEQVLAFFLDKPNFTYRKNGAGSDIRKAAGLEVPTWTAVAEELMRVSGSMKSLKSDEAKRMRLPNDTFMIYPDVILEGDFPYFTEELKEELAKKLIEAEQNN